jgi:selenocysteine-specific elongation factor
MPSPFTVAEFRDHFELSRKYAVPLLEWMDANGVTERDGDVRTVRSG